ncbi:F-box/LRR-repeat protein At4g29420 [Ananas comosus]|uniref:F-box/LRR-repeat protein At4g29420 n=1 Tax=Ananas comosus TaxID=4615 RepID=A0A6P5FNB1_ANACO|nr:F-box/LRR-repeat protein At4g29420 [Ananas comosus]
MEELPSAVVLEILGRLGDAGDLARCRLACRALRSLSYHVPSVRLRCSPSAAAGSASTSASALPFKTLALNLVSLLAPSLLRLSLAVDPPSSSWDDADLDSDADDLHLAAADFLSRCLPPLAPRLRSLALSDYWAQSCWRRSDALAVISLLCNNLVELEVRNAWLSVNGLRCMPKLTSLTLEFIRLDDENIDRLNECFPSLQVLNLIGVGGLKEPKLHLPQLKKCRWTISSIPLNSTIVAPNLVELEFTSVEPKILILETPSLSDLNLIIVKPSATIVGAEKCLSLRNLRIESFGIPGLARMFGGSQSLKRLEIEIPRRTRTDELYEALSLSDLLRNFPHLDELTVGPEAWFELQKPCNILTSTGYSRCLKKLTVHLEPSDFDIKFMALFLSLCGPLCEVTILFFDSSEAAAREQIVTKCASDFPMVRWKWGTRKKPNRNTL